MPITFPTPTFVGQTYSAAGKTWQWNGYAWDSIANTAAIGATGATGPAGSGGGGATGAGTDAIFWENDQNVTASYTITTNKNAMTAGPITVNAGVVVTIPSGSVWTVL